MSTIRDSEYEEDADVLSDVDTQTKSPVGQVTGGGATAAIQDLNGTELDGRRLYVRAYFT